MSDCKHRQIRAWAFADGGKAAPLWSCADCGHKFAPVDIAQEDDARRYRWLRFADLDETAEKFWPDGTVPTGEAFDAAIDAAMAEAAHG